jgi:hypothetical protein
VIADPRLLQVAVSQGVVTARLQLVPTDSGGLRRPLLNTATFNEKLHYWRVGDAPFPGPAIVGVEGADQLEAALAASPAGAFVWVEGADQLDPGNEGTVLLVPLGVERWRHVSVGREVDMVAYEEDRPPGRIVSGNTTRVVGRATVVDVNLRPDLGLTNDYLRPIEDG